MAADNGHTVDSADDWGAMVKCDSHPNSEPWFLQSGPGAECPNCHVRVYLVFDVRVEPEVTDAR